MECPHLKGRFILIFLLKNNSKTVIIRQKHTIKINIIMDKERIDVSIILAVVKSIFEKYIEFLHLNKYINKKVMYK